MKGKCEIFNQNKCYGCVGLDPQYDIDILKKQCEVYKEETKEKEMIQIEIEIPKRRGKNDNCR